MKHPNVGAVLHLVGLNTSAWGGKVVEDEIFLIHA